MLENTTEVRADYKEKVSGDALYVNDIVRPGMVYARLLRSPLPHARILGIDKSEAEALPGVVGVFCGENLDEAFCKEIRWGLYFKDRPIIAKDVVRYVGEPVVAVIAVSEAIAEDAIELIDVDYDVLPSVTEMREAAKPDAPLLHDSFDALNNFYFHGGPKPVEGTNICHVYEYDQGDVDKAFAEAHTVMEEEFSFPGVNHYAMEPHGLIADYRDDQLELWSNGQTPTAIQRVCSTVFGIPLGKIRIHTPYIGGGFGGKASVKIEPLAVALSKFVRRPVKMQYGLVESMLTCRRVGTIITMKTAVDDQGKLIARSIDVIGNCGAYADTGPASTTKAAFRAIGPYTFENLRLRSRAVYTNTVPAASCRSIGGPQATWAAESQIDELAHAISMDPTEFRRRNLAPRHGVIKADLRPIDVCVRDEMEHALRLMDETMGAVTASSVRGMAVAATDPGILPISGAIVRLRSDGHITVSATTAELGQGARGVQRLLASRYLKQPISAVTALEPDTQSAPYDWGTGASRSTVMVGLAIEDACEQISQQVIEAATLALEVAPDDVEIVSGGVQAAGQFYDFATLLQRFQGISAGEFIAIGRVTPYSKNGTLRQAPLFWETSAGIVDIEVDESTGHIDVNAIALCVDAGKVLNPKAAIGQDEGAIVQGLGHTLTEQYVYEDGQLINGSAFDYKVPTIEQIPTMVSHTIENGDGPGPFGSRGMGEGAILPIAPAIANAIRNKYGVRIRSLPLTPEKVWLAINQKGKGNEI
ncbi:xanthine dehydrogenase family protein molybdopterin-binding subunit [Paenalcaligenes niemegkensis]|uniref:xanthine dehydrogenase family protein molybdopterin-binding subunit n=1 Tax=Paenalcaligenes niemegkensis TaxID=2895469 RepID=UPI001EE89841|nr:xanthine dehydrogenase family protein molybdopterin-binding subunit [Paenalcaligenes niemegkensis]MCQ9617710.1 xanthine dehydrogenase family protein molybdopterin-binding subunit [Paenalcaligenes niemegkensis]